MLRVRWRRERERERERENACSLNRVRWDSKQIRATAIKPSWRYAPIDASARCYSTFDGRRSPWKRCNFFRHFLARGKQITFHSWHLLSVATAVGRIRIRIRLNKEVIWFSPPFALRISLFSRDFISFVRISLFFIYIRTWIGEWISLWKIFYTAAFGFYCQCRGLICGRRCAT